MPNIPSYAESTRPTHRCAEAENIKAAAFEAERNPAQRPATSGAKLFGTQLKNHARWMQQFLHNDTPASLCLAATGKK